MRAVSRNATHLGVSCRLSLPQERAIPSAVRVEVPVPEVDCSTASKKFDVYSGGAPTTGPDRSLTIRHHDHGTPRTAPRCRARARCCGWRRLQDLFCGFSNDIGYAANGDAGSPDEIESTVTHGALSRVVALRPNLQGSRTPPTASASVEPSTATYPVRQEAVLETRRSGELGGSSSAMKNAMTRRAASRRRSRARRRT